MKTRWLLSAATAVALGIFAMSIPSPIVSTKALAQMTDTNGQAGKGKKGTGTANSGQQIAPKKLYKSPGDRARCRMGNC
jgi:hypothetical protein